MYNLGILNLKYELSMLVRKFVFEWFMGLMINMGDLLFCWNWFVLGFVVVCGFGLLFIVKIGICWILFFIVKGERFVKCYCRIWMRVNVFFFVSYKLLELIRVVGDC